MNEVFNDLTYARHACEQCLADADVFVDMHGLTYWAERVETLRQQIKEQL